MNRSVVAAISESWFIWDAAIRTVRSLVAQMSERSEIRQHRDLHLSPTAIFISDETLGDGEKLRSVLARGLRFLFDQKFRDALDSMDHPMPDR